MQYTARFPKKKVSTVMLGTGDSGAPAETQIECIRHHSQFASKVLCAGPLNPGKANGVVWQNLGEKVPLVNALGAYMMNVPGNEVFAIIKPTVKLNPDLSTLLNEIEKRRFDVTWAAFSCGSGFTPKAFIMSSSVVPHIMRDAQPGVLLQSKDWDVWLHQWMKDNIMSGRYVDATGLSAISSEIVPAQPVMNAYDYKPEPKAKRTN